MPDSIHRTLIALGATFMVVGGYHRLRAARAGDKLDRTKEGLATMIGLRLAGLTAFGGTAAWLWKPEWFRWAALPASETVRWAGVALFGLSIAWLIWMFVSLGANLTDTVVTRKGAYLVERGPYRYVRNPMYTGILMLGLSLGLALGTWLVPSAAAVMFLILARRTRIEERYLIERFGDAYRDYMQRVGSFFPRLFHRP
jgi:protein-S-isoprenylcysteine O-methyltransferase Ste14